MSVRRVRDAAGIDPPTIHVDLTDADGEAERAAIMEILEAGDPEPRIERLRRFPELASRVAWLDRHLAKVGEDRSLHERLRDAEAMAYRLAAAPLVRAGSTVAKGRSKGGKAAAKAVRNENAARDAALAKTARALIAAQDATPRTVASLMVERGLSKGLGARQLRKILKQTDHR